MNDLFQPPKFTLHRSPRFWGGLGLIIVLWVWFGLSVCTSTSFTYQRVHLSGYAADRSLSIVQSQGGFEVNFWRQDGDTTPASLKTSIWRWTGFHRLLLFDPVPGFKIAGISRFFIPLWPLPVFCMFYWPLWLWRGNPKRIERKNSEQIAAADRL